MMRKALLAVGLVLGGVVASSAQAADCCHYTKVVRYETYTVCEYRTETYTERVTRYDHCGCPYTVAVVRTRVVKVPVTKVRPVVSYVRAGY
jgi:hypothetical protein